MNIFIKQFKKKNIPDINKSSLYRKDDFNKESTVNGIRSRFSPSNLYKLPLNDGIIRTQ